MIGVFIERTAIATIQLVMKVHIIHNTDMRAGIYTGKEATH